MLGLGTLRRVTRELRQDLTAAQDRDPAARNVSFDERRAPRVEARLTATVVEIFLKGRRIASHRRRWGRGQYATDPAHMPRSHREHAEWTPSRIIHWAKETGPSTAQLVEKIMDERRHPEQGYRASLGILRLSKRYSPERLEKACQRALACRSHSYRSVESMLKNRLEDQPLPSKNIIPLPRHENLRGSSYFQ